MSVEAPASLIDKMQTTKLKEIAHKVLNHERLSHEDGLFLFETPYEDDVAALADAHRAMHIGDEVLYSQTLYIHPTNLCELSCPMCSFYAKPGWESAWFLTPEDIEKKVKKAHEEFSLQEVHFVGGLWRDCNLDYYQEAFTRIKAINPDIHIKALTAVEYHFLAELHKIPIDQVFQKMKSWGLHMMTGGGAEVLVESIRKQVAPQKITSDEYLKIHTIAHENGVLSNITMLFGSVEENKDLVTHLCRVRETQDISGGFRAFIPLKYHVENNALGKRKQRLKPKNIRKVYAVSRLMLDNVKSIKVLWNYLGIDQALQILQGGGNDLSATQVGEKIITMAGGVQVQMTQDKLENYIRSINRVPRESYPGKRGAHA